LADGSGAGIAQKRIGILSLRHQGNADSQPFGGEDANAPIRRLLAGSVAIVEDDDLFDPALEEFSVIFG